MLDILSVIILNMNKTVLLTKKVFTEFEINLFILYIIIKIELKYAKITKFFLSRNEFITKA